MAVLMMAMALALPVAGCRRQALAPVSPGEVLGSPVADAAGPPPEAHLVTATPQDATATPVPVATVMAEPPRPLAAPPGFGVTVFAAGLGAPRFMAVAENGDVFVTVPRSNRIVALPDRDGDGVADRTIVFAEGEPLNEPHGIDFLGRWLYVANTDRVLRYPYQPGALVAPGPPETVFANLPGGPQHWTRTLIFGPDERMVVSVGSSCNVCVEDNFMRATIMHLDPDGSGASILARGLRNAVGLAYHPSTGELWATENGRDLLGDDLPPDELNRIIPGEDYGWPFCFGDQVPDPELGVEAGRCESTRPPDLEIPAHSAPLGIVFYRGAMFPPAWREDAFIAYHGSWNRSVPTGYKVVRVPFEEGRPAGPPEDFVTGWLLKDTDRWGRPVDLKVARDGALLVSDDAGGRIYRVFYAPVAPTPTRWR